MSTIDDGGPAFPMVLPRNDQWSEFDRGMSLRVWFAATIQIPEDLGWVAAALMGEPAPNWSNDGDYDQCMKCSKWWADCRAKYRLMEADAMLLALKAVPQ